MSNNKMDQLKPKKKIHKLILIEPLYIEDEKRKRKWWKCKCSRCGEICYIREDAIKNGQQSCGCYGRWVRHKFLQKYGELK